MGRVPPVVRAVALIRGRRVGCATRVIGQGSAAVIRLVDDPVRVIDAFVDELDLEALGFDGLTPASTGRPSYHPVVLLKIYIYGYLNHIQSSRRLERECQRNLELM
jgi:hypothetical protein